MTEAARNAQPTLWSDAVFRAKAALLQLGRAARNRAESLRHHPQQSDPSFSETLASSSTRLWTDTNPAEAWYQRGKIQNLRLAAGRLDRGVIPAGEVFSFWQQVGHPSARKGYAPGRMLQEGCLIPAIGGGLCQLSNALYQVALDAGCEIVERHPHSRVVPGSATAEGRDATVAWNYIDLRFRPRETMQLRVVLTAADLQVSLHVRPAVREVSRPSPAGASGLPLGSAIFADHACESCGNTRCYRHGSAPVKLASRSAAAFLLDNAWPEYRAYVAAEHAPSDILAIPLDGERWKKPQYAWPTAGFSAVHAATLATLVRAMQTRRLSSQGAARQRAMLAGARALAAELAKSLTPGIDEVYVSQNLLPFLWRAGALGGRRIRVLMTQLPVRALEAALDRAYEAHPESPTLQDFRADPWLAEAEGEALHHAEQIVTPHPVVASLFPAKVRLLDWVMPAKSGLSRKPERNQPPMVLFPAKTLGRKGAYELREALRGLDATLLLDPSAFEGDGFWDGFRHAPAFPNAWQAADLAVLPAIVEARPRALLEALAAGIPVLASPECGLHPGCGARFVPALDASALRRAVLEQLETFPSTLAAR